MKYLFIIPSALALFLVSCKNDKTTEEKEPEIDYKKTDLFEYKLNGKVSTYSERSYSYAGGVKGASASETSTLPDCDLQFNKQGMLTLEKKYNTQGISEENTYEGKSKILKKTQYINLQPGIITEYQYNKDGKLVASIPRDKSNIQINNRIEMVYQNKNMVEKNTYNSQNTAIDKIDYAYDSVGNMIEENIYMGTQSVKVKAVYEYDSKGHKITETRYNGPNLDYKTAYTYDNDNLISVITTGSNGKIEYSEENVYDANGNIIHRKLYETLNNSNIEETRTYDKSNNLTSTIATNNGKPQFKILYAYDKNNNVTSVMATDGTGKVLSNYNYAYTYDSNKNWTKKIVNIMDEPAYVIERNISYY